VPAEQLVHELALPVAKLPLLQGAQLEEPMLAAKLPAAQFTHVEDLAAFW